VLPRWTDNGTIIRPGTFPRTEREPTFAEIDEETLRRRSLREHIVTPEPGTLERTALWRTVGFWRERLIRRQRRAAIARAAFAILVGAACGVGAALAAAGPAASACTVRASIGTKSVVRASELRLHRRASAEYPFHVVGDVAPARPSPRHSAGHPHPRPVHAPRRI
jgi:hypothetical protein